jgi:ElaB/YqjD/DUF883 family membrane-anchored ribosome-binding protein
MTTTTDATRTATAARKDTGGSEGPGGTGGRLDAVRQNAADAYQAARERTEAAYASARQTAAGAGRRTAEGIDANPMAAVVGGLALGAIAAALLPRTQREEALFGDVGRRINDTAREAARAARETGKQQIDELGLSRDGVRRKLDAFTDRAVGAVRSSTGAAAGKGRSKGGK